MAMPEAGAEAPQFELPDQSGAAVALRDLRGGWVVLYFYPRADTPGCTTQACGVRDRSGDYAAAGARVLGISPDEVGDIAKFAGKYELGFTLLSDPDHAVAEKYGAWGDKVLYGRKFKGIIRSTFVIDEKGKIASAHYKVSPKGHASAMLEAL